MKEIIKIILAAVAAVVVLGVTFYVVVLPQNISHDSVPITPEIFIEGSIFRTFLPLKGTAIIDTETKTTIHQKLNLELDPDLTDLYDEIGILNKPQNSIVVYPTFTEAAYSEKGFYDFYKDECDNSCLTVPILNDFSGAYTSSRAAFQVLTLLGYSYITDVDIAKNPDILKSYDKLILLHSEYVTKPMFEAITNHANVIYLYPNALYAEVEYDEKNNVITLIRGHDYPPQNPTKNGFDWKYDNTHPFEFDNECKNWEFYEIENGTMLNCYPEKIIFKDEELLKAIKKFPKTELSDAEQIISKCEDDVLCAVDSIQVLAKNGKDGKIIDTFHELVSLYEKNYPCHMVAHHLGMWLYGYVGEIDEALKNAKMICGGAIYHGVLQKYLMTEHFVNTDPSEIVFDKICPENENHPYAIERWQCLHGLGHGLNVFYDNDVFEAIKICEQFDPGWEQISCSKGVFMQNVINNIDTGEGIFDEDDRLYPCNKVESKWAPQCYQYHPTYLLIKNKSNLTISFDDCDRITPEEFVKYCYHGMGRDLEQQIEGKISNAILYCTEGKQSIFHADCFRGMVMTMVNSNTNPKVGFQFCSLIPEEFKVDCYDGLGKWVHMLHSTYEGRSTECLRAENSDYFEICMNASLESLKLL